MNWVMDKANAAISEGRWFMRSRVVLTATKLDVFTKLEERPCNAEEFAKTNGYDLRATTRLLDCLVAIEMLEKQDGIYTVAEGGAYFSARHPESVLPMMLYMDRMWDVWSNLTDVVMNGGDTESEPGIHLEDEQWEAFIGGMHVIGRKLAAEIAADYDLSRFNRMLDIGGASGTYTMAFLRENMKMRGVLFDLPQVVRMARKRIAEEGLLDRVELVEGDFYRDPLPTGCDLALLSAIIHQNSHEKNLELYQKIFEALEPGGTILIREHIMDETRTCPPAGAMFAINMLVNRRGGDTYTFEEVRSGLEQAGFVDVKLVRDGGLMDALVEGRKAG